MKNSSTFTTMPVAARLTIMLFVALGLAVSVYAATLQSAFEPGRLLLLAAAAAATARTKVNIFRGSTISLLTSVVLLGVIREALIAAVSIAVIGVVLQTVLPARRLVVHQLAFNAGMIALTVTATWFVHSWLAGLKSLEPLSAELIATLVASFIYFLGNSLSVSLIIGLTKRISMLDVWLKHFLNAAPSFLLAGLVSMGVLAMFSNGMGLIVVVVGIVSTVYYRSVRLLATG